MMHGTTNIKLPYKVPTRCHLHTLSFPHHYFEKDQRTARKEHRININCLKRSEALVVNKCNKTPSDQPDEGETTGFCFKPNLNAAVRLTEF